MHIGDINVYYYYQIALRAIGLLVDSYGYNLSAETFVDSPDFLPTVLRIISTGISHCMIRSVFTLIVSRETNVSVAWIENIADWPSRLSICSSSRPQVTYPTVFYRNQISIRFTRREGTTLQCRRIHACHGKCDSGMPLVTGINNCESGECEATLSLCRRDVSVCLWSGASTTLARESSLRSRKDRTPTSTLFSKLAYHFSYSFSRFYNLLIDLPQSVTTVPHSIPFRTPALLSPSSFVSSANRKEWAEVQWTVVPFGNSSREFLRIWSPRPVRTWCMSSWAVVRSVSDIEPVPFPHWITVSEQLHIF